MWLLFLLISYDVANMSSLKRLILDFESLLTETTLWIQNSCFAVLSQLYFVITHSYILLSTGRCEIVNMSFFKDQKRSKKLIDVARRKKRSQHKSVVLSRNIRSNGRHLKSNYSQILTSNKAHITLSGGVIEENFLIWRREILHDFYEKVTDWGKT